jgi:hypothetical protein
VTVAAVFGGPRRAEEALGALRRAGVPLTDAAVLTRDGPAPVASGRPGAVRRAVAAVAISTALGGSVCAAVVWGSVGPPAAPALPAAGSGDLLAAAGGGAAGALVFALMGLLAILVRWWPGFGAPGRGASPGEALLVVDVGAVGQARTAQAILRRCGGTAVAAARLTAGGGRQREGDAGGERRTR